MLLFSDNTLNRTTTMRLLLLLTALIFNALYPALATGSICVSAPTKVLKVTEQQKQQPCHHLATSTMHTMSSSCDCCDDDTPNAIHSMSCDSGCCTDSMVSSMPFTTSVLIPTAHPMTLKPHLVFVNFCTRSLSPELQPPLV